MIKKSFCLTLTLALGLSAGAVHAFSLGDAAKLTSAIAAPTPPLPSPPSW